MKKRDLHDILTSTAFGGQNKIHTMFMQILARDFENRKRKTQEKNYGQPNQSTFITRTK